MNSNLHKFAKILKPGKAILWPDALNGGKSVDEFLWKGAPNAKPIQRAGLVVFGLFFWLGGVFFIAVNWSKEDDWPARILGSLIGCASILISIRLMFNAFFKTRNSTVCEDEE
jgi:hypothetical protein